MKRFAFWFIGGFWMLQAAMPVWGQRQWRHLDNMILVEHPGNDGDSFHTRRNRRRYLLRLYFVDTPEMDTRFPDRIQEQADYFGVTVEQVVEGAKIGDEFTQKLLSKGPFNVYTKYVDARGASRMKRIYAMVKVGDRWLCELLVEAGLARINGFWDDLPDGTPSRLHQTRLRALENQAKAAKRGIWGINEPEARIRRAGGAMTLSRETPIYERALPHRMVGQLPAEWAVEFGKKVEPHFFLVTFVSPGGNTFEGLIHEQFVPGD